jgi:hypothetical protein
VLVTCNSGWMVIDSDCGLDEMKKLFVAVTWKLTGPLAVGVPLITPLEGSSVRPLGSDPVVTAHVQHVASGVSSLALSACEYNVP